MSLTPRARGIAFPVVFALALATRGAAAPQIIPTNGAPPGPRTGLIVGQVVDSTGATVPEAIVKLTMPKYVENLPTTPKGRVMADAEGATSLRTSPPASTTFRPRKKAGRFWAFGPFGMTPSFHVDSQLHAL